MTAKRVLVCWPKVPFVRGGTEFLVHTLVEKLRGEPLEIETLELPLQHWPHESLVRSCALWRLLDLSMPDGRGADLVITTKFPSYFVEHPKKIVWLIHQFRQIYDWYGTPYSNFHEFRPDNYQALRFIVEHDRRSLQESRAIYCISENVRNRLSKFLGVSSEVLYPPPALEGRYYCESYEPFVLIVQRLEANKRTDLLIKSLSLIKADYRAFILGRGPEETALRNQVNELHLGDKIEFLGRVPVEKLLNLYARCRLVLYAPFDEDYGFVPLEAFLSQKPVVTAMDSGGPMEFVQHKMNGWIAEADPKSLAMGMQVLLEDESLAKQWGKAGFEKYRKLNWKNTTETLLKHLE